MIITALFYCIVTRFLYLAKSARLDLQLAVALLCKRVKSPNVEDIKKLGKLGRYVRATIHLLLILGSDGSGNMLWTINASIAVHIDMKSHTGYF